MANKVILLLSDGFYFEGLHFGARGEKIAEVVFNTSITGYQEILTDPSYKGQFVVMTYPHIGNYGINDEDIESNGGIKAEGLIVKENIHCPSNYRSKLTLSEYLKANGTIGISDIDTRALTRHIRDFGAQMAILSTEDFELDSLMNKLKQHPGISAFNYVDLVSTKTPYSWQGGLWQSPVSAGQRRLKITVYDFGVKLNILRHLYSAGFDVAVVPANTPAEAILEQKPDAVLLSNGPGDPQTVTSGVQNAKKLIGKLPLFGICLGHQILGLALGGKTYKLKFGHHGGNHPVKELSTGKVQITSQNHNYCVDFATVKDAVILTHQNLFDGSEEGMMHKEYPVMSVQYHPEAGPGPNDSVYIFRQFYDMAKQYAGM